jgi:hypothetical protein
VFTTSSNWFPDLVALRAGDASAWAKLIKRFNPILRTTARSYRLSPSDIDEVAQLVWVSLFQHIRDIRDPAALNDWLTTATRRQALRKLQSRGGEPSAYHDLDDPAELQALATRLEHQAKYPGSTLYQCKSPGAGGRHFGWAMFLRSLGAPAPTGPDPRTPSELARARQQP